ncbi:MAG: molybdate ABC transporter substrate-binding protein [Gemmatimonadales bacterium]|nr:molybdate ABC transporter substrate-binding protein [Gemmatimonadales bacterium]
MSLLRPLLALAAIGTTPAGAQSSPAPSTLTVFAAASLSGAFEELGALFRRRHPGLTLRFNFAGSQQLAAQLEHGAAADVFASADRRWMARIRDQGLAEGEPAIFAHNRLVVIRPAADGGGVERIEHLARPELKLVLAAEPVPAGGYSREVLRKLSRLPGFGSDYEQRVLANVVSEEDNVKGVVAKVQLGEADAGLVYRSDVSPDHASRLRVLELPAAANVVASYPIVVLAASRAPDWARAFVDLVLGAEGRATLARHGFTPPPAAY